MPSLQARSHRRTTVAARMTCPGCGALVTITKGGWVRLHGPLAARCWYSDRVVTEPTGYWLERLTMSPEASARCAAARAVKRTA